MENLNKFFFEIKTSETVLVGDSFAKKKRNNIREEMYVANFFERLLKKCVNVCRDKIMRKSVEKCQTYPKI